VAKRECRRCKGLMVERPCWERDWPQVSYRWPKGLYMWCCLICGDRVDATIEANRSFQRYEPPPKTRYARIWQDILDHVPVKEVA
jgi:hypothetical protein